MKKVVKKDEKEKSIFEDKLDDMCRYLIYLFEEQYNVKINYEIVKK